MSENSKIEWTDHTFNPWIGCTKVSPGCANCYAETLMDTRLGRVTWGKGNPRQRTSAANWRDPVKWNRDVEKFPWKCEACGSRITEEAYENDPCVECSNCRQGKMRQFRPRVFCASLADWLDDEVPIEWLADLLMLIHATPNLDWLLLTKRPENFRNRLEAAYSSPGMGSQEAQADWIWNWSNGYGCVPRNVWIGTTVEDQARADERIPQLLAIPARVRFLSCEPLLAAVSLSHISPINKNAPCSTNALTGETHWPDNDSDAGPKIDWVICGGESGANARPMHPDWARSLRDQCATAGVPFLFKQWGEWKPAKLRGEHPGCDEALVALNGCQIDVHAWMYRVGKKAAGRLLDGCEHNEFPKP